VLRLAVAVSRTPADVSDELFAALRARFADAQLVELSAAIAWENFRSRYNRLFDMGAQGFSAGAYCPMPERHAAS
jgi:alkylhydroperoxidase family enzyme